MMEASNDYGKAATPGAAPAVGPYTVQPGHGGAEAQAATPGAAPSVWPHAQQPGHVGAAEAQTASTPGTAQQLGQWVSGMGTPSAGSYAQQVGQWGAEAQKVVLMKKIQDALDAEKNDLLNKINEAQAQNWEAKKKWWSFCKAHGDGSFDPRHFDVAFLQTFFEAFQSGDIPDEPGCPYVTTPVAAQGTWNGSSFAKGGYKSDDGTGKGSGKGGWMADGLTIFAGGVPRDATEQELVAYFSSFGPVSQIRRKTDLDGKVRLFCFVSFQHAETVQKVLAEGFGFFKDQRIELKPARSGKGWGP